MMSDPIKSNANAAMDLPPTIPNGWYEVMFEPIGEVASREFYPVVNESQAAGPTTPTPTPPSTSSESPAPASACPPGTTDETSIGQMGEYCAGPNDQNGAYDAVCILSAPPYTPSKSEAAASNGSLECLAKPYGKPWCPGVTSLAGG